MALIHLQLWATADHSSLQKFIKKLDEFIDEKSILDYETEATTAGSGSNCTTNHWSCKTGPGYCHYMLVLFMLSLKLLLVHRLGYRLLELWSDQFVVIIVLPQSSESPGQTYDVWVKFIFFKLWYNEINTWKQSHNFLDNWYVKIHLNHSIQAISHLSLGYT